LLLWLRCAAVLLGLRLLRLKLHAVFPDITGVARDRIRTGCPFVILTIISRVECAPAYPYAQSVVSHSGHEGATNLLTTTSGKLHIYYCTTQVSKFVRRKRRKGSSSVSLSFPTPQAALQEKSVHNK